MLVWPFFGNFYFLFDLYILVCFPRRQVLPHGNLLLKGRNCPQRSKFFPQESPISKRETNLKILELLPLKVYLFSLSRKEICQKRYRTCTCTSQKLVSLEVSKMFCFEISPNKWLFERKYNLRLTYEKTNDACHRHLHSGNARSVVCL